MKKGTIIILNGTSSSGKTSIAKAFQKMADKPFLHCCIDQYVGMMPEKYLGLNPEKGEPAREGIYFEMSKNGSYTHVKTQLGPAGLSMMKGMHRSFSAMALEGNHLIIDDVIPKVMLKNYLSIFKPFQVFFIGVHCPLKELERREEKRQDRIPGTARAQIRKIHDPGLYDLELDTSLQKPAECIKLIQQLVQDGLPTAFESLRRDIFRTTSYPVNLC